MKVRVTFRDQDVQDPRVMAILKDKQWGWQPLSACVWETQGSFQLAALDQQTVARQIIEPFVAMGVKFRQVQTITYPLNTRISGAETPAGQLTPVATFGERMAGLAREASRTDPDLAAELHDLAAQL